ncbi:hypothetical protein CCHR01_17683 [Colletotrichum chrysophilum]|uniref:Uncharacterized protein n=1 Tax=Colletotrichum chrysophilum TaxID=1836956 RepID=A0AAD9E8V8_9PEZI|nr:hypothetical protein CCHR01_17683 [Colletotrichum chrysophilum]
MKFLISVIPLIHPQPAIERHHFPLCPPLAYMKPSFSHRKQALLAKWYSASLVMRRSGVRFTHEASRASLSADDFFLHFFSIKYFCLSVWLSGHSSRSLCVYYLLPLSSSRSELGSVVNIVRICHHC